VTDRPSATVLGLGFSASAALGWGVSLAAARHGVAEGLSPIDLAFIRYSIAGPLLVAWSILRWRDRTSRISFWKACALAMLAGPPLAICVIGGTRSAPFASGVLVEVASLAVACIVMARWVLKEPLDALRWVALCLLTTRIALIAGPTLLYAGIQERLGIVLFSAAGCMSAAFTALICRWRIAPVSAMALVSLTSFATYGPLYISNEGLGNLSRASSTLSRADRLPRPHCGNRGVDSLHLLGAVARAGAGNISPGNYAGRSHTVERNSDRRNADIGAIVDNDIQRGGRNAPDA
jgi:drug/metabolite transporter (DMT)-like permease